MDIKNYKEQLNMANEDEGWYNNLEYVSELRSLVVPR